MATGHTSDMITALGIPNTKINKVYEGRPNILDAIANHEIDLIVNTPIGKASVHDDSYIRKAAIRERIPYITTVAAASAAAAGIRTMNAEKASEVKSLQQLHSEIKTKI